MTVVLTLLLHCGTDCQSQEGFVFVLPSFFFKSSPNGNLTLAFRIVSRLQDKVTCPALLVQ